MTDATTTDTQQDDGAFADHDSDGVPDVFEKVLVLAMSLAAAAAARKLIAVAWKASTGRTPPSLEDDRGSASVVLLWGAVAGAAIGGARLLAERQARHIARNRRS